MEAPCPGRRAASIWCHNSLSRKRAVAVARARATGAPAAAAGVWGPHTFVGPTRGLPGGWPQLVKGLGFEPGVPSDGAAARRQIWRRW